jgi:hypothetical protein
MEAEDLALRPNEPAHALALPLAPMNDPIPFADRHEQQHRQQINRQDGSHASAGAVNPFPRGNRFKDQEQCSNHPTEL